MNRAQHDRRCPLPSSPRAAGPAAFARAAVFAHASPFPRAPQFPPAGVFRRAAGVTLLELLAVIAIVAILMAIGVPSYQYINNSYRISSEANGLLGDLEFARAEAIKEGQTVTACVSTDGTSCALDDSNWQDGWIVFSDPNGNQTVDIGDTVLRFQRTFTGSDTFEPTTAFSAVTFNREGFALNLPNGGETLTLHDKTDSSAWTRCLSMTVVGKMTVQTHSSDASCT